jgi:hypothetical protein
MSLTRLVLLLPGLVTIAAIGALLLHGPVLQFPDYNQFADRSTLWGVPNARNVLSNAGFALVGLLGLWRLAPRRHEPALRRGFWGYALFLVGVTLTACGSAYYHLAPQNARLVFDRLPIALACAGLLAAVRAEARPRADVRRDAALLGVVAIGTVLWPECVVHPHRRRPFRRLHALAGNHLQETAGSCQGGRADHAL